MATVQARGVEAQAEPGEDRVLTVPNVITLVRLLLVPVFLWLLLVQERRQAAALLLAVLGATDWVDGFLARRYGWISTVGKVLDPVADRVVLLSGVTAILVDGSAPLWLGIAVLVREGLTAVVSTAIAGMGKRLDVIWAGKAGTFAVYFAFPMFLASHAHLGSPAVWRALAYVCALPGLALGLWALGAYVVVARQALAERHLHATAGGAA